MLSHHANLGVRLVVGVFVLCAAAIGDVPRALNFQGRLSGFSNETVQLQVNFWNAQNDGAQLFSETHAGVPLQDGVFSIRIGSVAGGLPDSALNAQQVWLELIVDGGQPLPRTRLVSAPYAIKSDSAVQIVESGTFNPVLWSTSGGVSMSNFAQLLTQDSSVGWGVTLDDPFGGPCLGVETEMNNVVSGVTQSSILLDTNDEENGYDCDSVIRMWDDSENLSVRLHSDRTNEAAELSMFASDEGGTDRETAEILANGNGGTSATGGKLTLRRMPAGGGAAQSTVVLNAVDENTEGGAILVYTSDGTQVFSVYGGGPSGAQNNPRMSLNSRDGDDAIIFGTSTSSGGSVSVHDQTGSEVIRLSGSGRVTAQVVEITGADLAERFPTRESLTPGVVVEIDPDHPGDLRTSRGEYNRRVAGVVSGAGGIPVGAILGNLPGSDDAPPIALSGRVWVQADTSGGVIAPGDLLTTSETPGHAKRVEDHARAQGAIIGKAMTSLDSERGLVLVLVSLQ